MTSTGGPLEARMIVGDPRAVARKYSGTGRLSGLVEMTVSEHNDDRAAFDLNLEPWDEPAAEGYPTERIRIVVWAAGEIIAVPLDDRRRDWLHRNRVPIRDGEVVHFDLCLWYPEDPRQLRWEWADGLDEYITIVHRHLQAEECWRRTGEWPAEDAPHGDGTDGAHPIRSPHLQSLVDREGAA